MITQEEKLAALGKTLLTLKQEKKLAQAVALIDSELPAEALTSLAMLKKQNFFMISMKRRVHTLSTKR